jgi:putative DNA methylase
MRCPSIAVDKWFARRPGTLFRGLILSEFGDRPLPEMFFECNDFPGLIVADPFMGGGTPLIVREEIEHLIACTRLGEFRTR